MFLRYQGKWTRLRRRRLRRNGRLRRRRLRRMGYTMGGVSGHPVCVASLLVGPLLGSGPVVVPLAPRPQSGGSSPNRFSTPLTPLPAHRAGGTCSCSRWVARVQSRSCGCRSFARRIATARAADSGRKGLRTRGTRSPRSPMLQIDRIGPPHGPRAISFYI